MHALLDPAPRTLGELLRARAALHGDAPLFTFVSSGPDAHLTYAELDARARAVAAALGARHAPGERALLLFPPGLEFIVAFFGCVYAGVVPVHGPYPTRPLQRVLPRLEAIAQDAQAALALAPSAARPLVDDLLAAAPELEALSWIATDTCAAAPAGDPIDPGTSPDDLAFLQYTSGSTATPRGVMVTHRNVLANCRDMGQPPATKIVSWLPMFHDFGLVYGVLQPLFSGIPCVVMAPSHFLQRPVRWLEAISRHRATHSPAPNFAYDLCVRAIPREQRQGLDLRSWNVAINAAEPLRRETLEAFVREFAPHGLKPTVFLPAYGLAEATLLVSRHPEATPPAFADVDAGGLERGRVEPARPGAPRRSLVGSGRLHGDTDLRIVDPDTLAPCGEGEVGEIWVAGPSIAAGYWRRPEESRETFGARVAGTGEGPYLRTGDLGFTRGDHLFVTGRRKDLVIVNGRNHYPQDIERTVEACHRGVAPTCVAAFSADVHGVERLVVVAELERRGGRRAEPTEVVDAVRTAVAREHEVAAHVVVLLEPRAIPKTTSGKIQRAACKAGWLAGTLAAVHTSALGGEAPASGERPAPAPAGAEPALAAARPELEGVQRAIVAIVAKLLRCGEARLPATQPLGALGLDSIAAAELTVEIASRLGVQVSPGALFEQTLEELARAVGGLRAERGASAQPRRELTVVAAEPGPRAPAPAPRPAHAPAMAFSLFYFASSSRDDASSYRLILDSAAEADRLGFEAVWLPERHFHPFGGVCPNPSVLAAAVAQVTERLRIRAGSVILPLHDPIRVAEEWCLVDHLSGGRVDLSFGVGWNPNDFVLAPEAFADRRDVTLSRIEVVQGLWRGQAVRGKNGKGVETSFRVYPSPVQPELATWLTCSGGVERFLEAGAYGYNVLTALLFQTTEELASKIALYRAARERNGHDPAAGKVTLMLHTHLGDDLARVREAVRPAFLRYLESSVDLWRHGAQALADLSAEGREAALAFAFERYFQTAALFGTPETCAARVDELRRVGVDEIACLVDFGVEPAAVLAGLGPLDELRRRYQRAPERAPSAA